MFHLASPRAPEQFARDLIPVDVAHVFAFVFAAVCASVFAALFASDSASAFPSIAATVLPPRVVVVLASVQTLYNTHPFPL
jgi:hypothetical protein